MHLHFYHWHARAEFKPDRSILEARWTAAKDYASDIPAADVPALLSTILFPGSDPVYTAKLSEEMVKAEPTFEPKDNSELVRVMATAAAYSLMESRSEEADAIALGLQSAAFPSDRVEPVCAEIMERSAAYLAEASEQVRPDVRSQAELDQFSELEDLVKADKVEETEKITTTIAANLVNLGEAIERLTEENQFLWWLVGQQSPLFKSRREKLKFEAYALVAAVEAGSRVMIMPPAVSAEALLQAAVLQCGEGKNTDRPLADYIEAAAELLGKIEAEKPSIALLTPINGIRAALASGAKIDKLFFKGLKMAPKFEVRAEAAAQQYFRELVFLRALRKLD